MASLRPQPTRSRKLGRLHRAVGGIQLGRDPRELGDGFTREEPVTQHLISVTEQRDAFQQVAHLRLGDFKQRRHVAHPGG